MCRVLSRETRIKLDSLGSPIFGGLLTSREDNGQQGKQIAPRNATYSYKEGAIEHTEGNLLLERALGETKVPLEVNKIDPWLTAETR